MNLSTNFTLAELTVTTVKGRDGKLLKNEPNATELANLKALCANVLQPLRERTGRAVRVNSGLRGALVNAAVGGVSNSQHRTGEAADFTVAGMTPRQVCEFIIAKGIPFDQLILEFDRWTHVSFSRTKNRKQVLTAKKNGAGKTVYVPGLK